MSHAATQEKPKPEKTDCIATCGWGWGHAPEADDAIMQMLRHVPSSALERLRSEKKKLAVQIFECSEDWRVFDSGSIQGSYVKELGDAKIDPALALKVKDARDDIGESINYVD